MALSRVQRVIIVSLGFQLLVFDRSARLLNGVARARKFHECFRQHFSNQLFVSFGCKSRTSSDRKNGKFSDSSDKNYLTALAIVLSRLRLCSYLRVTTIHVT